MSLFIYTSKIEALINIYQYTIISLYLKPLFPSVFEGLCCLMTPGIISPCTGETNISMSVFHTWMHYKGDIALEPQGDFLKVPIHYIIAHHQLTVKLRCMSDK